MTVALESVMNDIANGYVPKNNWSGFPLIESIDRLLDTWFIEERSIEIAPEYTNRLKADKGYRKVVKQYFKMFPGYQHVDDCLKCATKTLEIVDQFGGNDYDVVQFLKQVTRFNFKFKTTPFSVYHTIKSKVLPKCESRNDFHGHINYLKYLHTTVEKKEGYPLSPGYSTIHLSPENMFDGFSYYKCG